MTADTPTVKHQGPTLSLNISRLASPMQFPIDDCPTGVTFVALMEILLSLYFFTGTCDVLIKLTLLPKSLQQYEFWWSFGNAALCILSVLMLIAGLYLFRRCKWARRASMLLAALNALCSMLLHCRNLPFSDDNLFTFFLKLLRSAGYRDPADLNSVLARHQGILP